MNFQSKKNDFDYKNILKLRKCYKPNSVWTEVHNSDLSGQYVAVMLKQATRLHCPFGHFSEQKKRYETFCNLTCLCSIRGLPCLRCRHRSGELLPRHFTITNFKKKLAVYFLWHFPWIAPAFR